MDSKLEKPVLLQFWSIHDPFGSVRVAVKQNGIMDNSIEFEPFGEFIVDYAGLAQLPRLGWIGKERDAETDFGNFGVRNYEFGTGRFLSGDALWEKHRERTLYHYGLNNPVLFLDNSGLDSTQRARAVEKANEYDESSSTYGFGSKGKPGKPVDCSGMVSECIKAGGEEDPVVTQEGASGVLRIENGSEKVDTDDAEPGNAISFRTGGGHSYHIGLITKVDKDEDGKAKKITFVHSSSSKNGPVEASFTPGSDSYWAKKVHGVYKWDTIPDNNSQNASAPAYEGSYLIDLFKFLDFARR